MTTQRILFSLLALIVLAAAAEQASAQAYSRQIQAPRARTSVPVPTARYPVGFNRQPISKPFKNVQSRPTVSPYLNLVRDDSGAAANYQTLVRPQMEQIDFNRQQQVQFDRLDRQFQNYRSESAYPQQGALDLRETGHTTRFMNRSHYYPN